MCYSVRNRIVVQKKSIRLRLGCLQPKDILINCINWGAHVKKAILATLSFLVLSLSAPSPSLAIGYAGVEIDTKYEKQIEKILGAPINVFKSADETIYIFLLKDGRFFVIYVEDEIIRRILVKNIVMSEEDVRKTYGRHSYSREVMPDGFVVDIYPKKRIMVFYKDKDGTQVDFLYIGGLET